MIVPFLTRFKNMRSRALGFYKRGRSFSQNPVYWWCTYGGPYGAGPYSDGATRSAALHNRLITSLCAAMKVGALSQSIVFDGVEVKCTSDADITFSQMPFCGSCSAICCSFPLRHVFERKFGVGKFCHAVIDTEVTVEIDTADEKVLKLLSRRPGGASLLQSLDAFKALANEDWEVFIMAVGALGSSHLNPLICLLTSAQTQQSYHKTIFKRLYHPQFVEQGKARNFFIMETLYKLLLELGFPISQDICIVVPHGLSQKEIEEAQTFCDTGRARSGQDLALKFACKRVLGCDFYRNSVHHGCWCAGQITLDPIRLLIDHGTDPTQLSQDELLMFVPPKVRRERKSKRFFIMKTLYKLLLEFGFPISEDICIVIPHGLSRQDIEDLQTSFDK